MSEVNLSVSVDDEHLDRFSEVVESCKKIGMKVGQQLESIGVITGSIDPAKLNSLRRVDGVSQIEQSREVHIAPPGSDVQ